MGGRVVVVGIFAADVAFRADRLPAIGETRLAEGFSLSPGGKGSNQAVAAARAGATVDFVGRIGADAFGAMARALWTAEGIGTAHVVEDAAAATGAAFIFREAGTGDNAILVAPGAGLALTAADVEAARATIAAADVLVAGLEAPLPAVRAALALARGAGVRTILNPAPAVPLDDALLALCDVLTPNEGEAALLADIAPAGFEGARAAAARLRARGVGHVIVTLGPEGALLDGPSGSLHLPALDLARLGRGVVDTTGAGDAFTGVLAAGLAAGEALTDAARRAIAAAGLSVTRASAAASMPDAAEIQAALN